MVNVFLCFADYRYGVVPRNYNTVLNNCNYQTDIRPVVVVPTIVDTGTRRRLFAGFRPLSGLGLGRLRSAQNRSISLPESKSSPKALVVVSSCPSKRCPRVDFNGGRKIDRWGIRIVTILIFLYTPRVVLVFSPGVRVQLTEINWNATYAPRAVAIF